MDTLSLQLEPIKHGACLCTSCSEATSFFLCGLHTVSLCRTQERRLVTPSWLWLLSLSKCSMKGSVLCPVLSDGRETICHIVWLDGHKEWGCWFLGAQWPLSAFVLLCTYLACPVPSHIGGIHVRHVVGFWLQVGFSSVHHCFLSNQVVGKCPDAVGK